MDLRQMEMFKTVAEMSSFTKAGEKLHVSHSAISRQVKLLEEELGVLLFARANKKVSLTEPGRALLGHVDVIFDQVAKATESVSQMSSKTARSLTVGTATTMLDFFLLPVFEEFRKRYPSVNVQIRTGQGPLIVEDVRSGKVDLAIGSVPMPIPGRELLVRPLYREELVIVVGKHHPLTKKKVIQAAELTKFPLLTFPSYSTTRQILDNLFHRLKISPNALLELENDEAIVTCVSEGMGIAFLPVKRAIQRRLHFLRLEDTPIFRTVGLFTLPSRQVLPHLACFSNLCFEHARVSYTSGHLDQAAELPTLQ